VKDNVIMKVLVTGAAGFVGSSLSVVLANQGHEVFGLDNFSDYYSPDLKQARVENLLKPHQVEFKKIDLLDEKSLNSIFASFEPDCCIHLAAQPGVRVPRSNYGRYFDSNLTAFSKILLSVERFKVKSFMFASTSSVYGDGAALPYTESEMNLNPKSFYGGTKLANEILAKSFFANSLTRFRAMRLFTVYGPWGRPDMAYLKLINSSLSGSTFTLFGDGSLKRDFTYIDDASAAISKLMGDLDLRDEGFGDVVNVGGGKPESMSELISIVHELTSKKPNILQLAPLNVDPLETCADHAYLESLVGQIPTTSLRQGIERCIQWASKPEISRELSKWLA
jgi:UDP-glucuronate 4-epimerase